MASNTVTDCTEDTLSPRTDGGVLPVRLSLEDVEDRLEALSEKITLCDRVLSDLKDLNDVLRQKKSHGQSDQK